MNDDILSLLLQAENEYLEALKIAAKKASEYAVNSKEKQNDYIKKLEQEWRSFEKSENNKLAETLAETERRLEMKTAEFKKQLQDSQKQKAGLISDRLKEEVLSLYGNR